MVYYGTKDERIYALERALDRARHAVVLRLPEWMSGPANTYDQVSSRDEAREWESTLVDKVIDSAVPLEPYRESYWEPRGFCPLCGWGTTFPYDMGFALPDGLRRHLTGGANSQPCLVLSSVFDLAREHWQPRLEEEDARHREVLQGRRESEELYLVDPTSEPLLRDEGHVGRSARDNESMAWAETRLTGLGFTEVRDGLVRSFTRATGDYVVYADPREKGRLTFNVFRSAARKAPRQRWGRGTSHASFYLLDSWKQDLDGKLRSRLEKAIETLSKAARS